MKYSIEGNTLYLHYGSGNGPFNTVSHEILKGVDGEYIVDDHAESLAAGIAEELGIDDHYTLELHCFGGLEDNALGVTEIIGLIEVYG